LAFSFAASACTYRESLQLVLSVLVGSVAIPIYWVQLEKIGASSQAERKVMFEQAFKMFDLYFGNKK